MTSMRENPIRRQPSPRPAWLVPALAVVAVLIVVGLIYAGVSLVRGGGGGEPAVADSSSPCVTSTVAAGAGLPVPAKVTVNVYNASRVSGLAGRTATELRGRGFKVAKIANDPSGKKVAGVGEIRYGPKGAKRAQLLAFYVPGAELAPITRSGLKVDLVMGDGFTGLAPQADVDAALAAPSSTSPGPECAPTG